MDKIEKTPVETSPAADATELRTLLSDEEWQELVEVALRADPHDPSWGGGWQRAPVLLGY